MKSKEEIKTEIARLKKDDRFTQPTSNIQVNAPLAMIQLDIGSRIKALEWVLKEK